jgi:hypothetical protein
MCFHLYDNNIEIFKLMDYVKIFICTQTLHIIITICQTHNICKCEFEQAIDLVHFKHICYLVLKY